MPRINLLPVKAAKRLDSARNELLAMLGIVLATLGGVYYWYASSAYEITVLDERIAEVAQDMQVIAKVVAKVDELKKKTQTLEQKLEVIEQLKRQKVGPAKLLDDLATILTAHPKVWLTRIAEKEGVITLEGAAMEPENISEFELALERESRFFKNIKLGGVNTTSNGAVKFLNWSLTCVANFSAG
jgi:type IV pilus assembly protein PilN